MSMEKTTEEQQLSSLSENKTKIAHNAGEAGMKHYEAVLILHEVKDRRSTAILKRHNIYTIFC